MCRQVYDILPNVLLKQIEIMNTEVIFDVLRNVRFNVLGSVQLVTPKDFNKMDDDAKDKLYLKLFNAIYDATGALNALATIEKNYRQLQSK